MPVHYASRTGDLDAIYSFAKKHKSKGSEDAAHAFGNLYKNKRSVLSAIIVCFSFDV